MVSTSVSIVSKFFNDVLQNGEKEREREIRRGRDRERERGEGGEIAFNLSAGNTIKSRVLQQTGEELM